MSVSIHIDKSGRIVIPKEMREDFGLSPGESLILEKTPQGILLKPGAPCGMVERDGIWSYQPAGSSNYNPANVVKKARKRVVIRTSDIA